jgi:hypothetical protein
MYSGSTESPQKQRGSYENEKWNHAVIRAINPGHEFDRENVDVAPDQRLRPCIVPPRSAQTRQHIGHESTGYRAAGMASLARIHGQHQPEDKATFDAVIHEGERDAALPLIQPHAK